MPTTRSVAPATRDVRIDLARGLCLWFILVDHMQGNLLGLVTLRSFAVCDAADVFVFLCGISVTLAYGRTFDRAGWWTASKSMLSRARTIYLAHLALLAASSILIAVGRTSGHEDIDGFFLMQGQSLSIESLLRLALLLDQPGYMHLLPLYVMLLSWFALLLPMINRPLRLLALSGALWVVSHMHLPGTDLGVGFNPLAWQLTFILGVLCCRYAHLLRQLQPRLLDFAAVALLAAGVCANLALPDTWSAYDQLNPLLRAVLRGVGKKDLDPGRVLSVLALTWVVYRGVPRDAGWLRSRGVTALAGLGQHSLPVFAVGVVLSSLGGWALFAWDQGIAAQVAANVAGLAGLLAAARLAQLRRGMANGSILGSPPRRVAGLGLGVVACTQSAIGRALIHLTMTSGAGSAGRAYTPDETERAGRVRTTNIAPAPALMGHEPV